MEKKQLPLRTGVGIVVLNKQNRVFVAKRKDNPVDNWQMPQGGVDEGEDLLSAMQRELLEETSIHNIKILKKLDYWLEYKLPENLIGIIWKGKYSGQKQKWFIVKFTGEQKNVKLVKFQNTAWSYMGHKWFEPDVDTAVYLNESLYQG